MDVKATALLKLIYLEMFGHDMSWASFNVLEVMSSSKYFQKRVGYLGAVQSFRPDTEVLMLATNLLKKDVSSPLIPTISLPLITLPHIITPSLALSLLNDLMPRLSHSNPSIRKKTVVALYRLALAYPETLRTAWPKIKDLLMDDAEDSSVTAAVINVVCELGWRRPRDFLPLAPRLFDLLVDGGNNWMAIKIIKLFATLTPLEPRLTKKLLPPLMTLIRTTPAMSLLYECINGIIQGGILEATEGAREGEQVASLCVGKLRGMIASDGDPNLRYVALLAFKRIVQSHPDVVASEQETILNCIDDPDVSIRLQALELGSGMVSAKNIKSVVDRLLQQLRAASCIDASDGSNQQTGNGGIQYEDDEENNGMSQPPAAPVPSQKGEMPFEYRMAIIRQIIDMCSKNTYANIVDFRWYLHVLIELVHFVPARRSQVSVSGSRGYLSAVSEDNIALALGAELRNIAVRVMAVRAATVRAADSLIISGSRSDREPALGSGSIDVLEYAAWIAGEYTGYLSSAYDTLSAVLTSDMGSLESGTQTAFLQAVPKLFVATTAYASNTWDSNTQTSITLLIAKIIYFLEPLTLSPILEVQERAVECLELMRLTTDAVKNHAISEDSGPLLLIGVIPPLFTGAELKPVANAAQRKVPLPSNLDFDMPLNVSLANTISDVDRDFDMDAASIESEIFYYEPVQSVQVVEPAINRLKNLGDPVSYQQAHLSGIDIDSTRRRRLEQREKNRDDPYYIGNPDGSTSAPLTPLQDISYKADGEDVDLDAIPIMDLDLEAATTNNLSHNEWAEEQDQRQFIQIVADETFLSDDEPRRVAAKDQSSSARAESRARKTKGKKSLLEVDSRGIGLFDTPRIHVDDMQADPVAEQNEEEREMAKALAEVENLRLEMQRAADRVQIADDMPVEGTLIKKRRKKKPHAEDSQQEMEDAPGGGQHGTNEVEVVRKKEKKKKKKKTVASAEDAGLPQT